MRRIYGVAIITVLFGALIFAQGGTVNPNTLKFVASADHVSGKMSESDPAKKEVAGYRAVVTLAGATTPTRTIDLGLPTPATVDGVPNVIQIDKDGAGAPLSLSPPALPAGNYTLSIDTFGPDGVARSVPAVPFVSVVIVPPAVATNVQLLKK